MTAGPAWEHSAPLDRWGIHGRTNQARNLALSHRHGLGRAAGSVRCLYDPQPLSLPDGQLTADVGRYPFTGCGVEAHSP